MCVRSEKEQKRFYWVSLRLHLAVLAKQKFSNGWSGVGVQGLLGSPKQESGGLNETGNGVSLRLGINISYVFRRDGISSKYTPIAILHR